MCCTSKYIYKGSLQIDYFFSGLARTKAYWLKIWKQENVSLRHLCPARHFSVKTIILPEDLEFYIMMYMCTKFHGNMTTSS
jgi:hypothetical protein